jgi:hypothetical protein
MGNYSVIMMRELVKGVGESIIAITNYGICMQMETTGNLIQDSRFYDRDFNWNQLKMNQELFL